jgi:multicomponent Na+:H+ antiporter subunit B
MLTRYSALIFAAGLAFLLFVLFSGQPLGTPGMVVGQAYLNEAPAVVGAANIVTSVVLAYRGIDTMGELAILFTAATAIGLVLGRRHGSRTDDSAVKPGGFILQSGIDMLFPLLLMVGMYIILHGHLTPGGGFQGGVVLAAAFVLPVLARPTDTPSHTAMAWVEGLAGAAFIITGLAALAFDHAFLTPLLSVGQLGALVSAGTLPVLYLAVGLKVGAELASLLLRLTEEVAD